MMEYVLRKILKQKAFLSLKNKYSNHVHKDLSVNNQESIISYSSAIIPENTKLAPKSNFAVKNVIGAGVENIRYFDENGNPVNIDVRIIF